MSGLPIPVVRKPQHAEPMDPLVLRVATGSEVIADPSQPIPALWMAVATWSAELATLFTVLATLFVALATLLVALAALFLALAALSMAVPRCFWRWQPCF